MENLKSCRVGNIMIEMIKGDYPILDIGDREGHTEYLDFINVNELKYPIMKGYDCNFRMFIIIKVIISGKMYAQIFFRRYIDDDNFWMGCMVWGAFPFITTLGGMQLYQAKLLQEILKGSIVRILPEHRPIFIDKYEELKEQSVMLYDEEKIKAAKLIQRNWEICRYNPEYKICKTIFYEGISNLKKT